MRTPADWDPANDRLLSTIYLRQAADLQKAMSAPGFASSVTGFHVMELIKRSWEADVIVAFFDRLKPPALSKTKYAELSYVLLSMCILDGNAGSIRSDVFDATLPILPPSADLGEDKREEYGALFPILCQHRPVRESAIRWMLSEKLFMPYSPEGIVLLTEGSGANHDLLEAVVSAHTTLDRNLLLSFIQDEKLKAAVKRW